MSRTASDLILARTAANDYRIDAVRLDAEARKRTLAGMPLTQRILRHWAIVARRAAHAEELDPDVPQRNCRVCGGETVCV